jgi:ArsR family transcriptional regulator, lead/cadmium/zinc/bismuth-responsive transcriptional repressor
MLTEKELKKMKEQYLEKTEILPSYFSVLGDKTRYRIFQILLQTKEVCVSEIATILAISPSAVSQHLKIFEQYEMIRPERHGQMVCYLVQRKHPIVKQFIKLIDKTKS